MYEEVKSVVDTFTKLKNYECALLAFGATASGKTHSMQGPRREYPQGSEPYMVDANDGLLQRCIHHILTVRASATVPSHPR